MRVEIKIVFGFLLSLNHSQSVYLWHSYSIYLTLFFFVSRYQSLMASAKIAQIVPCFFTFSFEVMGFTWVEKPPHLSPIIKMGIIKFFTKCSSISWSQCLKRGNITKEYHTKEYHKATSVYMRKQVIINSHCHIRIY